jgi:signal transduction histidine kinase
VDITDRKNVESQLEQALERERAARGALERARAQAEEASRLKDEFLSIVSHELRTPLNAILGWSQLLSKDEALASDGAAKLRHGLDVIRRNAEAQKRLVEDLLDVQRIVAGKLRIELAPVPLETLVRGAVESMHPAAAAKHVDLLLDVRATPSVMGDAARLHQAVWNLLSNAIKFTPSGGRVTVELEATDDRAIIRVQDTGVGVDPAFLPWMFEPFRQADASASRNQGGLGLGLAIVRRVVELHGGRVRGESAGPWRGATFVIELPVSGRRHG